MNIIAINGSPRKNGSTHILLNSAIEGAKGAGAETRLISLYDLDYKGCRGCLACKLHDGGSLGRCAINDGLKPVLDSIDKSDGLILGSPVYFGDVSSMMRAFLERLIYQYANLDGGKSFFGGSLKTAFIYAMNAAPGTMDALFEKYSSMLGWYFSYEGTVEAAKTLQVGDYSKYHLGVFNEAERIERRATVFPEDCRRAYDLGKAMATPHKP